MYKRQCMGSAKFLPKTVTLVEASFGPVDGEMEVMTGSRNPPGKYAVSYTHLTLPTSDLV